MKKTLIIALSVFGLSSFAVAAPAVDSASNPHQWQQKHLQKMQKSLDLTDAQRQQVELIYQNAHQQHKAISDDVTQQLKGVLTAEQQAKFDKQREARQAKMKRAHLHKASRHDKQQLKREKADKSLNK